MIMAHKVVRNAVRCTLCGSPADLINNTLYQCQRHPGHMGDTFVGIFTDCSYPEKKVPKCKTTDD
jgi:hypothetical protein